MLVSNLDVMVAESRGAHEAKLRCQWLNYSTKGGGSLFSGETAT